MGATQGRAPSLFNGGLAQGPIAPFLILAAIGAAYLEMQTADNVKQAWPGGKKPNEYVAADYGFDPVELSSEEGVTVRTGMQASELINGRLSMLAITGFAVPEFLYGTPVVQQTPFFFGR